MYFADFWSNFFQFYDDSFVLLSRMGIETTPIT